MERGGKIVAWSCIFSTLLMGCYTSAAIDPDGEARKIQSSRIESVITKDGKEYRYDGAPELINDVIVGNVIVGSELHRPATEKMSIPLSDVAEITVSEFSTWRTVVVSSLGLMIVVMGILGGSGLSE